MSGKEHSNPGVPRSIRIALVLLLGLLGSGGWAR